MGLLCLQLHPYFSCSTSNVLPNQLASPFAIKVGLDLRVALHHNLAKRAIAGPRLIFFHRNTESCTWITRQVLDMTASRSTRQIKDFIFPDEPERNDAREPRGIKRRQMCWNGQSSQIGNFLRSEFTCHTSSTP